MHTVPRLYTQFQPKHYDLTLTLEREKRTFHGTVTIDGRKMTDDKPVVFHAKDITVTSARIDDTVIPTSVDINDALILEAALPKGDVSVTLEFNGTITDGMHGLYPCYFDIDGKKKELLATQFESHHAREVFPCVDEPEAKSTFDLTLITESHITALSNMPISSQISEDDIMTTRFERTPKMSSYLLAFVVGELHKKTAHTKSGVEVNLYATPAHPDSKFDFGLDAAVRSIEFFDDYFGVPYPLPKADHIALPDFSSGAMENWGLITYRESCLLADTNSAQSTKELIATVIAHETSHQWFGNLVTMKWWDDLWLNESFATVMEYIATDAMYPSWNMWNIFASHESLGALRRDQLAGVQAVKAEVNHPDEISTLFDPAIVYAKGARLLKMLHAYVGDTDFKAGLAAYFKQHAYGNTTGKDLWAALSKSSGKDIEGFMDKWISQSGFPVLTLKTTESGYRINQDRFVIGEHSNGQLWPVPLEGPKDFPELLEERSIEFSANHSLPLLNRNNTGHYIVNYDQPAFALILENLSKGTISPLDRLALLHETTLLARTDRRDTASLLPLLDAYRNEDAEPVWNIIAMVVGDLKRFVEDDEKDELILKKHILKLTSPLNERLGFVPRAKEAEDDGKLRATIMSLRSYADDPDIIEWGLETFKDSQKLSKVDHELRAIVFGIVSKHGDDASFDTLLSMQAETVDPDLRDDITSGLCATRDNSRIRLLLERLDDQQAVRLQDVSRWYIQLLRNRYAREATWEWMTTHWQWIKEKFAGDKSYDDFPRYGAGALSSRIWLERYETFFSQHTSEPALARAIEIGLTEISTRVEWIESDKPALIKALRQ